MGTTLIEVEPVKGKLPQKKYLLRTTNTMKHILIIAKLSGLFFFTLDKSVAGKLQTADRKKSLCYTVAYLSSYLPLIIYAFQKANVVESDGSFYTFVKNAFNGFCCGSIFWQVCMGFVIKKPIACWFNSLAASDAAMETVGLFIDCSPLTRFFNVILLMQTVLINIKMSLFLIAFQRHWPVSLCVAFYYLLKSTLKMIHIFLMYHLHLRFQQVNAAIDSIRPTDDVCSLLATARHNLHKDTPAKLDTLCKFHFRLCHLSKKLNAISNLNFFYCFSVALGTVLFFSYYLYHNIRALIFYETSYSLNNVVVVLFGVVEFADEIIGCLMITKSCRNVCHAANCTPKYLHGLRNRIESNLWQWDDIIKDNSLKFLHQKVKFSAQEYFNIDFGMLTSMMGIVVGYLVLFIQYDHNYNGAQKQQNVPSKAN